MDEVGALRCTDCLRVSTGTHKGMVAVGPPGLWFSNRVPGAACPLVRASKCARTVVVGQLHDESFLRDARDVIPGLASIVSQAAVSFRVWPILSSAKNGSKTTASSK